jgi:predicted enzyme related to lactoylglutathione lyase
MASRIIAPVSSVRVDRIGQIAITVTDLARAKSFYQHRLGIKFLFDAGGMSFFQCGDVRFLIGTAQQLDPRAGTIVYFTVTDARAAHASLSAQGVEFIQEPQLVAKMPNHDLWIAFLKDPDGNVVGLMSENPRSAAQGA